MGNAAERLERAADEARTVAAVVEATAAPMSRRDPLRPKLDVVLAQAEAAAPFKPSAAPRDAAGRVRMDDLADADLDYGCDAAGLAALRRRLTRSTGAYNGVRAQYVQAVQEALRLERESGAAPGGGAAAGAAGTRPAVPVGGRTALGIAHGGGGGSGGRLPDRVV